MSKFGSWMDVFSEICGPSYHNVSNMIHINMQLLGKERSICCIFISLTTKNVLVQLGCLCVTSCVLHQALCAPSYTHVTQTYI